MHGWHQCICEYELLNRRTINSDCCGGRCTTNPKSCPILPPCCPDLVKASGDALGYWLMMPGRSCLRVLLPHIGVVGQAQGGGSVVDNGHSLNRLALFGSLSRELASCCPPPLHTKASSSTLKPLKAWKRPSR